MFPEYKCDHIAEINYAEFYSRAFGDAASAHDYFARLEPLPQDTRATVMLLLHQVARMVWVADRLDDLARGRPAFQVMFYLIAAELAAKIRFNFAGIGQSRKHVHRFFEEICTDKHRAILARAFGLVGGGCLDVKPAVDLLYNVRCDVVHMGAYYGFSLRESGYTLVAQVADLSVTTNLSVEQLRQIVLEGAKLAADWLIAHTGTGPHAPTVVP
jgi:hypothetical protein